MGKDSWSGYTNSFSKPFMEILFSYLPFKFLVRFLFPQLLTDPSAAEYQLPLIVFDKGPEARVFLKIKFWAPLRSSDKNGTGLFQGAGRQVKQGQCFGNGLFFFFFFEVPQTSPAHPVIARLLLFKVTADLSKERWEQFKLQCHKPCSMRLSSFSWVNTPQIVGSLWLISRVLK